MTRQVKFGYFHTSTNQPQYVTVAISRPSKDDEDQRHYAAFSFCDPVRDPKDVFVKARGRNITKGRLNSKEFTIEVDGSCKIYDVIQGAIKKAVELRIVPSWVRRTYKDGMLCYGTRREAPSQNKVSSQDIFGSLSPEFDFNQAMAILANMFGEQKNSINNYAYHDAAGMSMLYDMETTPFNPPGVTEVGECKECKCGCSNCG